jgi:hypothetical protein
MRRWALSLGCTCSRTATGPNSSHAIQKPQRLPGTATWTGPCAAVPQRFWCKNGVVLTVRRVVLVLMQPSDMELETDTIAHLDFIFHALVRATRCVVGASISPFF